LGRIGAPDAVVPLVKALAEEQLLVREAATRALDWLTAMSTAQPALRAAAAQVAAQLAAEQGKVQYQKVNEDLKRLQVKLARL
jgi:HEAT repeat protein